jgi:hypothetical protein
VRAFDLPGEDDELLAQQGVLSDQVQAGAGQIRNRTGQGADGERLGPPSCRLAQAAGHALRAQKMGRVMRLSVSV